MMKGRQIFSFAWPLTVLVVVDENAYGVPGVRRIPLWLRIVALAVWIQRVLRRNRRRHLLQKRLAGRRILITGGASGLGLMLARKCVREGADVVIVWDVRAAACSGALTELRRVASPSSVIKAQHVDVTDRTAVYRHVEELQRDLGPLDVVVMNAGVVGGKALIEADDESMERTMAVNATSHFWLVRAVLPGMLERDQGHVVCISSAAAMGGTPGLSDYSASKAAAFTFAESLRMEVRKAGARGVHVTTVCPYFISTGMFAGVTSRWRFLLPILEPEHVAQRILDAIKAKDPLVIMPPILHLVPVLRGVLPVEMFDRAADWLGVTSSMDFFVGRSPT
mmetsp:Transcript_17391/g.46955  ORF Transcript_17391/g.46955 Transcript_17391/m.46955 type:complete len:337 (+) Transcript_17391:3-1013(+)